MSILFSLLGSKNMWIVLIVLGILGGGWFKLHSLQSDLAKSAQTLAVQVTANEQLKANNTTLKQNLELAISLNEQNAKIVESLRLDQDNAATSLTQLATDLSAAKLTLTEARRRLLASKAVSLPVPQAIVDAVLTIQQSRTEQAAANKKLEVIQ